MDEGDHGMEQFVELQQNTQPPSGDFPSSVLSAFVREREMRCPRYQSQNATSFICWTLSGRPSRKCECGPAWIRPVATNGRGNLKTSHDKG
jgi:hypothetical protein